LRIPTLLAVCVFSLSAGTAACQEAVSGTDTVIAVSFKTLAKALVAQDGIQRLTSRIETMDDAEFSVRYKEAYGMLVSVPGLQSSYGLKKGLSRKEMLAVLKTWDGRKVCALIDSVPDAQVSAKFNEYLAYAQERGAGSDPFKQIQILWGRVVSELRGK